MIAALFVERLGAYAGLPDVELWDVSRDAQPVVFHRDDHKPWLVTLDAAAFVMFLKRAGRWRP